MCLGHPKGSSRVYVFLQEILKEMQFDYFAISRRQTANTYRQEAVQALQLVSKENVQLAANKLAAES